MNLSDTFYVALCMTVLILGVVYWFWTQNQYIQRKLNLLENIVYEMKTSLNATASAPDSIDAINGGAEKGQGPDLVAPHNYPPPPGSELGEDEDLLHEELHADVAAEDLKEEKNDVFAMPDEVASDTPAVPAPFVSADDSVLAEDLQPGGVGSGVKDASVSDGSSKQSMLDGMTRTQLKRLAEQKGIQVKPTMSKQTMIDAIRAAPASPFETHEATVSLN